MPHPVGVRARVEAVVLASGTRKVLVEDCADARYLPTGHLVCARQGTVVAAPFDAERLELTGPVVPVVQGVAQALNTGSRAEDSGAAQVAVSASGLLAYAPGGISEDPPGELLLVDEAGRAEPLPGFDRPLVGTQNRFSPDGRRLAFTERASSGLLWLFDVERGTHLPLSRDGIAAFSPWSPDGTRLVVGWSLGGAVNLWLVPTGGGEWMRLTESELDDVPSSWSPDGRVLAFVRDFSDVFLYRFEDRQVVSFLTTPANERYPEFSPDGRWLAYASNESGRHEIYVTSFPDRKHTLVVSREGGAEPAWSRDGRRLFYRSYAEKWMLEVPVRLGETLALGRARRAFPAPFAEQGPARGYDLLPSGRQFLFTRYARWEPGPPTTRLNLVHNWFAELERLCPTRR
jgi:WD40-like Beta Propeller Repeat